MFKGLKRNERGFTLIELLLISVIILLIAVSIILPFRGGGRTWRSADKGTNTIQNAVIGMEKVVREIKNSPGLSDYSTTAIRLQILREDTTDLDGDGNTTEYITKYAMIKRSGDYLKYGERDEDSDNEADWTLSNLAYPVTNLSFAFYKGDGSSAVPGTDPPEDVKSILINMTTSEAGVTVPLNSRAYLVMNTSSAVNFDGTPDDPSIPGPDPHTFNEGDDELGPGDPPPGPGAKGDGVKGWSLSDYAVYGDREVSMSNSSLVYGNVGTRSLAGNPYNSQNGCKIYGYLIVKGTLNMSNAGVVNGDSVAAAYEAPSSNNFANNSQVNGNYWTKRNITMSNSSWINGTVYQPTGTTVTLHNSAKYNNRVEIDDPNKFAFMDALFPALPGATDFTLPGGANKNYWNQPGQSLPVGSYGNVDVGGSSSLNIYPGSSFNNLTVSNSSVVIFNGYGDYYFNYISMSNSSKLKFDFQNGPIRIYVKGNGKTRSVELSNSSSFEYVNGGANGGADLLYIEAQKGFICSNSVQFKGYIYAPNGDVYFSNATSLIGAIYSDRKVELSNNISVTYQPPLYSQLVKLLPDKFYPAH